MLMTSVPKELSHREASFLQYRAEQLGQVQPDMGNVDGHVIRLFQRVCKPEKTRRSGGFGSNLKPLYYCSCGLEGDNQTHTSINTYKTQTAQIHHLLYLSTNKI